MFRGSAKSTWLPTPFASFPFTFPPVRHRVTSYFNWTLQSVDSHHSARAAVRVLAKQSRLPSLHGDRAAAGGCVAGSRFGRTLHWQMSGESTIMEFSEAENWRVYGKRWERNTNSSKYRWSGTAWPRVLRKLTRVLGKGMIFRTLEYSSVTPSVKKSQCCMEPESSLQHGCINTGHPVARATKFFAVVPNILHVLAAYFF